MAAIRKSMDPFLMTFLGLFIFIIYILNFVGVNRHTGYT